MFNKKVVDVEAREWIKALIGEISNTPKKPFNEYEVGGHHWSIKNRLSIIEGRLDRLMKHLGLEEIQPDCSPIIKAIEKKE